MPKKENKAEGVKKTIKQKIKLDIKEVKKGETSTKKKYLDELFQHEFLNDYF